jgi:hypothetical protein
VKRWFLSFYRVITEFHLTTCWQRKPYKWQIGTLYYDGLTYHFAHLGWVTMCLHGYEER